ncbi:helix-turn-helix domain-containing protein [Clostridioides difficile]|nr:helix-turn-helix transcriptional regulator [Clostridioides difficile]HBF5457530.1 helix-turn-helix transcriptional regulator [Clostridioides difficile]
MNVHERIKFLRENMNMSQKELSEKSKINASVMNRIESGERPIRDDELIVFANIFNVSTDYLLGLSDNKNKFIEKLDSPEDIKNILKIFTELSEEAQDRMLSIAKVFLEEEKSKK